MGAVRRFEPRKGTERGTTEYTEHTEGRSALRGPARSFWVVCVVGRCLVRDRNLAASSWAEEKADNRDDIVPFNPEEELKARGARYTKAWRHSASMWWRTAADHRTEPQQRARRRRGGRAGGARAGSREARFGQSGGGKAGTGRRASGSGGWLPS